MGTILIFMKVLGVVIQKGVELHKSGADKKVLDTVTDAAHALHAVVHEHHSVHCPDSKLADPEALKE